MRYHIWIPDISPILQPFGDSTDHIDDKFGLKLEQRAIRRTRKTYRSSKGVAAIWNVSESRGGHIKGQASRQPQPPPVATYM